jgi:hypothetical protein
VLTSEKSGGVLAAAGIMLLSGLRRLAVAPTWVSFRPAFTQAGQLQVGSFFREANSIWEVTKLKLVPANFDPTVTDPASLPPADTLRAIPESRLVLDVVNVSTRSSRPASFQCGDRGMVFSLSLLFLSFFFFFLSFFLLSCLLFVRFSFGASLFTDGFACLFF